MEELELPWVAGTFVADIFLADVPKYSDFFEPNIPGEENFSFAFFGGERGQEQVTIARFCINYQWTGDSSVLVCLGVCSNLSWHVHSHAVVSSQEHNVEQAVLRRFFSLCHAVVSSRGAQG